MIVASHVPLNNQLHITILFLWLGSVTTFYHSLTGYQSCTHKVVRLNTRFLVLVRNLAILSSTRPHANWYQFNKRYSITEFPNLMLLYMYSNKTNLVVKVNSCPLKWLITTSRNYLVSLTTLEISHYLALPATWAHRQGEEKRDTRHKRKDKSRQW